MYARARARSMCYNINERCLIIIIIFCRALFQDWKKCFRAWLVAKCCARKRVLRGTWPTSTRPGKRSTGAPYANGCTVRGTRWWRTSTRTTRRGPPCYCRRRRTTRHHRPLPTPTSSSSIRYSKVSDPPVRYNFIPFPRLFLRGADRTPARNPHPLTISVVQLYFLRIFFVFTIWNFDIFRIGRFRFPGSWTVTDTPCPIRLDRPISGYRRTEHLWGGGCSGGT